MTLPAYPSAISMSQVNVELGLGAGATITLNDAAVRSLFGKPSGAISMSDGHGKGNVTPTVEYLVVGGGGGASSNTGYGAGGAGGLLTAAGYAVTKGSPISVVVGSAGVSGATASMTSGGNSAFGTITSVGGGRGGVSGSFDGAAGGSGGGGAPYTNYGAGTSGQGYRGGVGYNTGSYYLGGGGGGAGGVGGDCDYSYSGGVGGPGVSNSITGTAVVYSRGGGAKNNAHSPVTPGSGASVAVGGAKNGLVVIRYPNTYPDAASVTGSPTLTNTGGYKIYQWTSVGTWSITF